MIAQRKRDTWERLVRGKPVNRSELTTEQGLLDLRNVVLPDAHKGRMVHDPIAGDYVFLEGVVECKGLNWDSIDFSGSQLNSLRFHDCMIADCVFDDCRCQDWRMWTTNFRNCTFYKADLRESNMGAVINKQRNTFRDVDFSGADFRGTGQGSAEFSRCFFKNTKLNGVDFRGSVFTDCVFEGELHEVLFWDHDFHEKNLSPNEMLRVDFSRAKLSYVEFRRLNVDTVRFPEDDNHIIISDSYPKILNRLIVTLGTKPDPALKRVASGFALEQKWLGPNQRRGVLSKSDIIGAGGAEGLDEVLRIIGSMT